MEKFLLEKYMSDKSMKIRITFARFNHPAISVCTTLPAFNAAPDLLLIYWCTSALTNLLLLIWALIHIFKKTCLWVNSFQGSALLFQHCFSVGKDFVLTFPGVTTLCFSCSSSASQRCASKLCCFVSFCPDHYLTSSKLFANIKSLLCCSFKPGYCMAECRSESNYA